MKILVTGGTGFIGQRYCEAMESLGHTCYPYDMPNDILDIQRLTDAAFNCNMIVHFAAMADITVCHTQQDKTFDVNVRGTYNVARVCAELGIPMVFISTCCVYGNSLDDYANETRTNPQAAEPYACSKVAGEAIVKGVMGLRWSILRIGTVYGPGQRDALFTAIALDKVRSGETIQIDGDGMQSRQLIYIDDLIDGIVRASDFFRDGFTFNLCGDKHITAMDTMRMAERVAGKKAVYVHREQRYGQTLDENISNALAKSILDWKPSTDFFSGMRCAYEWKYGSRPA